jgi:transposase InsO family protein
MDEERKKQTAVFRFGVISDFVGGAQLERGERERLLREKCARKWQIPFSHKTRLGRSTIQGWVKAYQDSNGKLESLYPDDRSDQGESRAIDAETALALTNLRKANPKATLDWLIQEMDRRLLVPPGVHLAHTTVWRFLDRHGLLKPSMPQPEDRRKFEAELPNDIWQSDSMHGPTVELEGKNRKSYLFAFLDDHSRLVPHGEFYSSESIESYLDCFKQALLKRGLPRKLYVDNGAAFRSQHLEHTTASLGIALVHSRPYKPQGRGKIERLFRTVREQFLPDFKGGSLNELNLAFELWLQDVYHPRKHSSTGQSPFERFTAQMQCMRAAPENLLDHFRKSARRKVAKDRTISLNGKLYEAPVALIGKQVVLLYHPNGSQQNEVEVFFNQQSYGTLIPVDLHVNCRVKRDKYLNVQIEAPEDPPKYQGGRLWSGEEKP